MAYVVRKRIKNHLYRYLQRSYRIGSKVRTESHYLGPDGSDALNATFWAEVRTADDAQRRRFGETGQERADRLAQEKLDQLHEDFGLRAPEDSPKDGAVE